MKVLGDGWTAVTRDGSLSAHFEHTVAVTADGPWILTAQGSAGRARAAVAGRRSSSRLPSARCIACRLDEGSQVTAHIADRIDRNFVRVLVGDRVRVELSPVDCGRGRIVRSCTKNADAAVQDREEVDEGASVGQADLRQVQDRAAPRRRRG